MPIKPINHYSLTNPASVYDEEAMTALELSGRTAAKVNEAVEAFNKLEDDTNARLTEHEETTIPDAVAMEVQTHIDGGDFDEAISEHLGDLDKRVDTLFASYTAGSTTKDAEINDAHVGQDGVTYVSLGKAIRGQFEKTTMLKTLPATDANLITETGIYTFGSGLDMKNVPYQAGALIVINKDPDFQFYQIIIGYNGAFYVRHVENGTFTEWVNLDQHELMSTAFRLNRTPAEYDANTIEQLGCTLVRSSDNWHNLPEGYAFMDNRNGILLNLIEPTKAFTSQIYFHHTGNAFTRSKMITGANPGSFTEWTHFSSQNHSALPEETDLNTVKTSGYFFIRGSVNYYNLPEANVGGMLEVNFDGDYRWYQKYMSASTGAFYYRNFNTDWTPWKRLTTTSDIALARAEKEYVVEKRTNTSCYIYKRGEKGMIRYEYGLFSDNTDNVNVWKAIAIDYCDFNKNVISPIGDIGAEIEGVILLNGETDHIGGIHGDEQMTESFLFINGKRYTFDTIETMEADEIQFIVKSTIAHENSTSICFNKIKRTVFDRDGLHTYMEWTPTEAVTITSIRACMMSVNKNVITHCFDSNVEKMPIAFPASEGNDIISNKDLNDVYYVGEVSIRHWTDNRGGDAAKQTGFIKNYGYRLKSYFTCYDNYATTIGEKLTATNHIYITC